MDHEPKFDERQRTTLIILGVLVALTAIVVVIVFAARDSSPVVASSPNSRSSSTASSLVSPVLTTSTTTLTTSSSIGTAVTIPTTGSGSAVSTVSTTPAGAVISTAGAVMAAPKPGDNTAPYDAAAGCLSLAEPGFEALCGVAHTTGGDLIWVTEKATSTPFGRRAFVYSIAGDQATIQLVTLDDNAANFVSIGARVLDLTGDGADEIVFGFRSIGTGKYLDLDIVGGQAKVIGHRSLDRGAVRITGNKLESWSALFAPTDADCCPSQAEHSVVRFSDGTLRVEGLQIVPSTQVPASDF